jgi:hypothetical protein
MKRNTILGLSCAAAVALTTLAACSTDATSDKYPDASSFCSAKADAECQNLAPGCNATVDGCKSLRTTACTTAGSSSGRSYTPSLAQACIDKVNAVYAKKSFTADDEQQVTDACERVFAGAAAKNAPCKIDYDCQGQMICDKGVCGDKLVRNQGEGCNNPGEVCGSDAYCGNQGSLKFCLPRNPSGHTCDVNNPCLSTLRCLIGNGAMNGSCAALENPGDPCDADTDCSALTTPPYCDPTKRQCLPKYGLGTKSCADFGGH